MKKTKITTKIAKTSTEVQRFRLIKNVAVLLAVIALLAAAYFSFSGKQIDSTSVDVTRPLKIGILEGVYKYGSSASDLQYEIKQVFAQNTEIVLFGTENQFGATICDLVQRDMTTVCDLEYNKARFEDVGKIIRGNQQRYPLLYKVITGAFAKNFYPSSEVFVLPCTTFLPPRMLSYRKDYLQELNASVPDTIEELAALQSKIAPTSHYQGRFVYYCHIGKNRGFRDIVPFFNACQAQYSKNIIDKIEIRGNNVYISDIDENAYAALIAIAQLRRQGLFNSNCLADNDNLQATDKEINDAIAGYFPGAEVYEHQIEQISANARLEFRDNFGAVAGKSSDDGPLAKLMLVSFPQGNGLTMAALDFVESTCLSQNQLKYYENYLNKSMLSQQTKTADEWDNLHLNENNVNTAATKYRATDFANRQNLLSMLVANKSEIMIFNSKVLHSKQLTAALKNTDTIKDKWFELIINSKDNVEARKLWDNYLTEWQHSGGESIVSSVREVVGGGF